MAPQRAALRLVARVAPELIHQVVTLAPIAQQARGVIIAITFVQLVSHVRLAPLATQSVKPVPLDNTQKQVLLVRNRVLLGQEYPTTIHTTKVLGTEFLLHPLCPEKVALSVRAPTIILETLLPVNFVLVA